MKKKITWILMLSLICVWMLTGCGRPDASAVEDYVQATLDLRFQGDTDGAGSAIPDRNESELQEEYEQQFEELAASVTAGMELSDYSRWEYENLFKEIFRAMRYKITEVEETGKGEYTVSVEIRPVDVLVNWEQDLIDASEEITAKAQAGEYQGTAEEITDEMQSDFLIYAYGMLEDDYLEMQYGEPETVELRVSAEKKSAIAIEEEDLEQLFIKILRMDEIQG